MRIVMSMSVCLCVCLSARITQKALRRTSPIFVHIARVRGSVLLWPRCDTLCKLTSGIVDDVTLSYNGQWHVMRYSVNLRQGLRGLREVTGLAAVL